MRPWYKFSCYCCWSWGFCFKPNVSRSFIVVIKPRGCIIEVYFLWCCEIVIHKIVCSSCAPKVIVHTTARYRATFYVVILGVTNIETPSATYQYIIGEVTIVCFPKIKIGKVIIVCKIVFYNHVIALLKIETVIITTDPISTCSIID